MTGNVNLSIVGGTISRRIYGGCYNEYTWSGYETSAFVTGRISVLIGGNANITLNYSEDDKGIFACSRIKSNKTEEVACIIFADETAYSKYNNKIGSTDGNSFLIGSNSNAADNICRHTYTANGDVITQTCTNVKGTTLSSTATATLSIEGSDFVENGKEIKPAKVTYSTGWEGPKVDVTYSNNINAGTATATAEINGVKVTKTFHIHGYETAFDAYGHKLVCSVCGDVKNSESHKLTYVDNGNGTHNQVCDCGYKTSAVSHSYANKSEGDYQWKECVCGNEIKGQKLVQEVYDWTVAQYTQNVDVENSLIKQKGATFWYYDADKVDEPTKANLYMVQNKGINNTALTCDAASIPSGNFRAIGTSKQDWNSMYVSMKGSDDVSKKYLQLGYDLGAKANITKIAFLGSDHDNHPKLMPYHYMISVADEEADLFTENAVVNEFYNNATANGTNAVIFTPNEPVEGRFVAFRFIKTYQDAWTGASDTSAFVRLTHIAVEGCLHDNIVVKSDDVNHWRECSDCGEKFDVEKDEFTCTKIDDDTHKFLCSCGKSNTEEHNYRLENDKFICDDCNSSINAYKIKFNDLSGKTYYETYVSPTGLTQEQIAEAKESAPVIFGYTFTGEFDTDANLPVVADTTYTAQYTRESTKYTVEVNSVSGSHSGQYEFDTALKIADPNAKSWTVDNQLVGVGTDIKLYVAGDMTIIGSENEETNPGIAIIGNRMSNGRYFVMAVATPNGKTIQESGVIYSDGNREKVIKSSRGNSELFMTALNGAPSYITAKAYIKVDGVYYYSNIVSNIGFIVTPDDNNDQNDGFIGDNNSDTWD